jgi:hypothetical protein
MSIDCLFLLSQEPESGTAWLAAEQRPNEVFLIEAVFVVFPWYAPGSEVCSQTEIMFLLLIRFSEGENRCLPH